MPARQNLMDQFSQQLETLQQASRVNTPAPVANAVPTALEAGATDMQRRRARQGQFTQRTAEDNFNELLRQSTDTSNIIAQRGALRALDAGGQFAGTSMANAGSALQDFTAGLEQRRQNQMTVDTGNQATAAGLEQTRLASTVPTLAELLSNQGASMANFETGQANAQAQQAVAQIEANSGENQLAEMNALSLQALMNNPTDDYLARLVALSQGNQMIAPEASFDAQGNPVGVIDLIGQTARRLDPAGIAAVELEASGALEQERMNTQRVLTDNERLQRMVEEELATNTRNARREAGGRTLRNRIGVNTSGAPSTNTGRSRRRRENQ